MKYSKRGIPLTRCSETLTEAAFFGKIRSHARRMSIKWKPRSDYLKEIRSVYSGSEKRTKWIYPCHMCGGYFKLKEIEVDHIIPCGSLTCFDDIGPFYERLLCEKDGFITYCKSCHRKKTNEFK